MGAADPFSIASRGDNHSARPRGDHVLIERRQQELDPGILTCYRAPSLILFTGAGEKAESRQAAMSTKGYGLRW